MEVDDLYAGRAQPFHAALEVAALSDDHHAETKLPHKAAAIPAGVAEYHGRIDRFSESDIQKRLKIFDTMIALIPARPQREVDAELKEIRRARRSAGRLTRAEKPK